MGSWAGGRRWRWGVGLWLEQGHPVHRPHLIIPEPSEEPQIHARTPGPDPIADSVFPKCYLLYFISLYHTASHVVSACQSCGLVALQSLVWVSRVSLLRVP